MDFPHIISDKFLTSKIILSSGKEKERKKKEIFSKLYLILKV